MPLKIKRTAEAEFLVKTGHLPKEQRADATLALISAAHEEFPGLRFVANCTAHASSTSLIVVGPADTPDTAFERLTGWGHGELTVEERPW